MHQQPIFKAHQTKEYSSYQAGWSFGKLYYTANTTLTEQRLLVMISTLNPNRSFDAYYYRLGFDLAYRLQRLKAGNPLTSNVPTERRNKVMGKLSQAKAQATDFNGFVKASQLVELAATFCIRKIDTSVGRFGAQWDIQVQLLEGVLAVIGADEDATLAIVTIARNTNGKETGKDRMLKALMGQEPIHNCKLVSIPLKNGNTYLDFVEVEELPLCVCGEDTSIEPATLEKPF